MKRILPLIIGLVLGLGGGTGYVMFLGGSESPAEADVLADTAGSEDPAADSTEAPEDGTMAGARVEAPADDPEEPPSLGSAAGGLVSEGPLADLVAAQAAQQETAADSAEVAADPEPEPRLPVEAALALGAADDEDDEPAQRLAKIFGTMQARDAARVLSLLRHDEIERILRQLDDRSAAKILSSLDAELAAALSSNLIGASR